MADTEEVPAPYNSLTEGLAAAQQAFERGSHVDAQRIWSDLRNAFSDHPAAFQRASAALAQLGRYDDAEILLRQGRSRFPSDAAFAIDMARLSHMRRDWTEAQQRWNIVRQQFANHIVGYTGSALSSREAGHSDEAETLLLVAIRLFPNESAPLMDYAWAAHLRRAWPEANLRWAAARISFPNESPGYTNGAVALRELRKFDDAESLLREALARFPNERAPAIEHAWLAWARRDWAEAAARWELVRRRFPGELEGYVRNAGALSQMWLFDEAQQILLDGMYRFPNDCGVANDYALVAFHQGRDEEAILRFDEVRRRFPNDARGYLGSAKALRNRFQLKAAEAMLERAHAIMPDEPSILLDHAVLPMFAPLRRDREPAVALNRLAALRATFPLFEEGYVISIKYLRDEGFYEEADSVALAGTRHLPKSDAIAVEYGKTASERGDWTEAMRRFDAARALFPAKVDGGVGLARALSFSGQHAQAEAILCDLIARFPAEPSAMAEFALVAVRQNDWKTAFRRWSDAGRQFPDEKEFTQRVFDARLRLAESESPDVELTATGHVAVACSADPLDQRTQVREMIMQFESLGGRGIGCEFGMFQREFAAEPLGLLRWADMPYEGIVYVLENRFAGVGTQDYTEVFINRENSRPEFCTKDKRGFMYQRCFIYEGEITEERMWKQALRRLPYLRDKLVADLESGDKIFVWRQTERDLTDEELRRLHDAVRSFGNNTLLYVRYEDAGHPNGTVESDRLGLLIGYIDRFKMSKDGVLSATPASSSWMRICSRAHALWKKAESDATAQGAHEAAGSRPNN